MTTLAALLCLLGFAGALTVAVCGCLLRGHGRVHPHPDHSALTSGPCVHQPVSRESVEAWADLFARDIAIFLELRDSRNVVVAKLPAREMCRWRQGTICMVRLTATLPWDAELATTTAVDIHGRFLYRALMDTGACKAGTIVQLDLGLDIANLELPIINFPGPAPDPYLEWANREVEQLLS